MKKTMFLAILLLVAGFATAQKKGAQTEKRESDKFRVESSKIIPKLDRLAIAQLVVHYKLTTTAKAVTQERSSMKIAGARVTAYLEFTDGDLTQENCQEISDYFYSYFQKKLKAGGIDTVGWNTVTAHEFYQKVSDDEEPEEKKEKGGNEWMTANANNGKKLRNGMAGFAGNKGKRAVALSEDTKAIIGFFELTLDFADVMVNLDIKTRERKDIGGGWYYPEVTTTKYTWAINPEMRIGNPDNAAPLLSGTKGWPEFILLWNDIASTTPYHDVMSEDMSKARSGLAKQFAFRKELTPVMIQTTRAKYIVAAKKACEAYADAFVEMCQKKRKK